MASLVFRPADPADAPTLASLVRRAYRGQEGWTTEAAMLNDERIDATRVLAKIKDTSTRVLVATDAQNTQEIVGCCEIVHISAKRLAYFGMFAVEPRLQAGGFGRAILKQAEDEAVKLWGVTGMEMTVIAQRDEIIGYYERRGYQKTGETRPFSFAELINGRALRDDLHFIVLLKSM